MGGPPPTCSWAQSLGLWSQFFLKVMNLKSIWAVCRTQEEFPHWCKMAESVSIHVSSHLDSGSPEVKGLIKHTGISQSNKNLGLQCIPPNCRGRGIMLCGKQYRRPNHRDWLLFNPGAAPHHLCKVWATCLISLGFIWFFFSSIKWKVPSCSHLDSVRQCQSPRDTQQTWMDYFLHHCYEYQHAVFWLSSGCVQASS